MSSYIGSCDIPLPMKTIISLLILASCTQKYADYDLIRKADFERATYSRPVTLIEVLPQGKDDLKACFNQWLFLSNAEADKNKSVSFMVRSLCPGKDFLVNTEMKETWWTTLLFTRSCIEMESLCGEMKKK
ncbi:MAG TPA: hypothetical protein VNJ08_05045 [Bacteriovoracaceae bacterium]|nr:hypothetical protein [Bacteriovoracaceae bacterium]